jgi:hypothetical protein
MKKTILILFIIFCNNSNLLAQKKKIKKIGATTFTLAKAENVSAEMINKNLFAIRANAAGVNKDSIVLKTFTENSKPTAVKITPFTAKGKKLFLISWSENVVTTTKLKTEDALIIFSEIVNFDPKSKVLSNTQTTVNIQEIHFLDAKQTVSETLQKVRREGFEFNLKSDGDISLKNKTQENKMTFNMDKNLFVPKK